MKKIYLFFTLLALVFMPLQAQVTVDVDPNAAYVGYMVVTNLPAPDGDGAYQFEGGWGAADLVLEATSGTDVVLKPNRIGDIDPYWQDADALQGKKYMNASGFVEVNEDGAPGPFTGEVVIFQGNISAFTLNSTGLTVPFEVSAFIKRFTNTFGLVEEIRIPITATGNFSLTSSNTDPTGVIFQYGFTVLGPNINSRDEDSMMVPFSPSYDDLGSVVALPFVLSTDEFKTNEFNVFPNPTNNNWNVKSTQNINSIQVYDVLGKQVLTLNPNTQDAIINASTLHSGIYFARINSNAGTKTLKLVKE